MRPVKKRPGPLDRGMDDSLHPQWKRRPPRCVSSLLPLEDVGQHGPGRGQLTHLAQELGLGVLAHQAGRDGHGAVSDRKQVCCLFVKCGNKETQNKKP